MRISRTEEQTREETEDQLVKMVCELTAAADTTVNESDISIVNHLGDPRKQGKARLIIVTFVSRRQKADLVRNKVVLRNQEAHKTVVINYICLTGRIFLGRHFRGQMLS